RSPFVNRASPAINRVDSIRQTVSIVRSIAGSPFIMKPGCASVGSELVAHLGFFGFDFGGQSISEILGGEEGADFELTALEGSPSRPFGRFVHVLDLPYPVPGQQFLGLGEGSVGAGRTSVLVESDPHAFRAGV